MKNRYKGALISDKHFPLVDFFEVMPNGSVVGKANILTYDLETTGIHPYNDNITQFAYSIFSPEFKLIEKINYYCKLKTIKFEDIDPEIVKKTKITKSALENGKNVEDVIKEFLRKADKAIVLSYNGWGFDDKFITTNIYKYVQRPFWPTFFSSDIDVELLAVSAFFKTDESMSLRNVARMAKVAFDENDAHNANYDVFKTTAVIPGILRILKEENEAIFNQCVFRLQKNNFQRWRFKRYEKPWPATEKQLRFVYSLYKNARLRQMV